jgi:hypothetical protein
LHNNPRSCEGYLKKEEETPFMYLHLILGSTSNNYICFFFTGKKNRQSSARPGWPCPSPTSLNNAYAASLFRFRSLRLRGHPPVLYKSPSPSTGSSPHAVMRWTYRDSVRGLQVDRSKEFWLPCHIAMRRKRAYMQGPRARDTAGSTQVMERRLPANTLSDQSGGVK